jgi:hypothetical protein
MFKWIIDALSPRRRATLAWRADVDALEAELDQPLHQRDPATLVPVILPLECLKVDWPGPIVPIPELPFAIAWATIPQPQHFIYVSHEQAAFWEELGVCWKTEAFRNLARISEGRERWAGEKLDDSGKPFVLALLQDDSIGPSRLLLPGLFADVFGSDYCVAIPERTCAIIYRSDLTAEQRADVDNMIDGCFRHGTEPMSPDRFDPSAFWILGDVTP